MSEIRNEVKELIADQLGTQEDEINDASVLVDHLGIDSLDLIEIVVALEEKYDIAIADEDGESFVTVGDVCSYVEGKVL